MFFMCLPCGTWIALRSLAFTCACCCSANLNNVLRNIIYKAYADVPGQIPLEEVIVVFDADMQAKPCFFTKVGGGGLENSLLF
jgi:hypothetical protein